MEIINLLGTVFGYGFWVRFLGTVFVAMFFVHDPPPFLQHFLVILKRKPELQNIEDMFTTCIVMCSTGSIL